MRIKAPRDFWAGLMFIGFGIGFGLIAQNYQMGTAVRMGPAYFPTVLGGLLAILGLAILVQSLVVEGSAVPPFLWRPIILILVAIVLFGVFLKPLGLLVVSGILVVVAALGGHEFRWKEAAILGVVLAVFSAVVFVKGLGLPFPIWPGE
ncbi:MAG: tripartite tricarboxylate transporter TctB family protein [Burkholderiales bacterium]